MANTKKRSFRFVNDKLNRSTIRLLEKVSAPITVDENDVIHYSAQNEEMIENELIRLVRAKVFPRWAILSCPNDWIEQYKRYMDEHGIQYQEELIDGQVSFLLPAKYNPHRWKLS